MGELAHKSHNISGRLYHAILPDRIPRVVITEEVEAVWRHMYIDIGNRFEITLLEVGADCDHDHFLVQSVPTCSPKKIVRDLRDC